MKKKKLKLNRAINWQELYYCFCLLRFSAYFAIIMCGRNEMEGGGEINFMGDNYDDEMMAFLLLFLENW